MHNFLRLLLVFMLFFVTSCSKEEANVENNVNDENQIKNNHSNVLNSNEIGDIITIDGLKEINISDENTVRISTKTGDGLEKLENKIEELFNTKNLDTENEIIITNIRHKDLISKTIKGLNSAIEAIETGIPIDMISININDALKSLGEMLGESVSEDVLNKIFEKFCVGK